MLAIVLTLLLSRLRIYLVFTLNQHNTVLHTDGTKLIHRFAVIYPFNLNQTPTSKSVHNYEILYHLYHSYYLLSVHPQRGGKSTIQLELINYIISTDYLYRTKN